MSDIQKGHMTLLVYNTLTALMLFEGEGFDSERFTLVEAATSQLSEEDDEEDDAETILAKATGDVAIVTLIDRKKAGKQIGKGDVVSGVIKKMSITQGNIVLYGQLL